MSPVAHQALFFIFVLVLEYRVLADSSLSLSDLVFVFAVLLLIAHKADFVIREISCFINSYTAKLVFLFLGLWLISFILPVISYSADHELFFRNNYKILIGAVYLVLIFFYVFVVTSIYGFNYVLSVIFYSGALNSLFGIIAVILWFVDIDTGLVCAAAECTSSPYFSDFPRLTGLAVSPNGYAYFQLTTLFSGLAIIPILYNSKFRYLNLALFLLIMISIFLSFSQLLMIAFISIVSWIGLIYLSGRAKIVSYWLVFLGIFAFLFITHFLVVEPGTDCKYGDEIVWVFSDLFDARLCPSYFLNQKVVFFSAGIDYFPWGIGASNDLVVQYSQPHTVFLERFSLHGLTGLASLLILCFIVYHFLRKIYISDGSNYVFIALLLFWISHIVFGFNMDFLRFRELWVMLGVTVVASMNRSDKVDQSIRVKL